MSLRGCSTTLLDAALRLLSGIAIGIACTILAVTLGPFYLAGGIIEWWRGRRETSLQNAAADRDGGCQGSQQHQQQ